MRTITIRGGTVIDGSGAPRYRADLRVEDGQITAIASDLPANGQIINATGRIVAPGLIDVHSHLDAEALWTPAPTLARVGVTTAIVGNCGFSLGPWPREIHGQMLDHLCAGEGWDRARLAAALPYPYPSIHAAFAALDTCNSTLNLASYLGYDALLAQVGADLSGRAAPTPRQIIAMARALREGLDRGALGLSVSFRRASRTRLLEVTSLLDLVGPRPSALLQTALPENVADEPLRDHLEDALISLCLRFGMTATWTLFAKLGDPDYHRRRLERLRDKAGGGASVAVQVMPIAPGPLTVLREASDLHRLLSAGPEEQQRYRVVAPGEVRGLPLDALAEQWLPSPLLKDRSSVGQDLVVQRIQGNPDWRTIGELLDCPHSVVGGSDSGAAPGLIQNAGMFPVLLSSEARARLKLPLEEAVHRLTGQLAARFGLLGRGCLTVGAAADILIFDPDRITANPPRPAFEAGRVQSFDQTAAGISAVLVGGSPTFRDGHLTGAYPGAFLPISQNAT
ncbi:amidohydrolase family protein [Consotaella aegiceratis]|uniref:amidohydrolase family protein n=1 Tax=Consotaella aegiceratis TaxID=3097961 RepID=UPI002F3EDD10